jgi:hypothetical protein
VEHDQHQDCYVRGVEVVVARQDRARDKQRFRHHDEAAADWNATRVHKAQRRIEADRSKYQQAGSPL